MILPAVSAPNAYTVDGMIGRTIRSGKPQAPIYSLVFKNEMFDFCFDWAKVCGLFFVRISRRIFTVCVQAKGRTGGKSYETQQLHQASSETDSFIDPLW